MKHVVVIGGGITGLACADALRAGARVTLLEGGLRWGRQILTRRVGGFLVEGGADSLYGLGPDLAGYLESRGVDLCPAAAGAGSSVLHEGRLHELPPGLARGLPDRPAAFLRGGLLSLPGKLRMGMDLVMPRGVSAGDISLGAFLRRRLGQEALERIAEPLLAGIHLARADELSLLAAYPWLAHLEREHRSLYLGLRRTAAAAPAAPPQAPREGMESLVSRLMDAMPGVQTRLGAAVRRVRPLREGTSGGSWRVEYDGGILDADRVVLAVPATQAGLMLRTDFQALSERLASIRYRSCATVTFGFAGRPPFESTSLFMKAGSRHGLVACSVASRRYQGRAPGGSWILRCFLGGAPGDAAGAALEALGEALGPLGEPVLSEVHSWRMARPVYEVGHPGRVSEIEGLTPPGLYLSGSAYRGGGVPDCLADGRRTAASLLAS